MRNALALAAMAFLPALSYAQTDNPLTLNPTDDAHIIQNEPDRNTGYDKSMWVKNRDGVSSGWEASILLKFDLSSIQPGTMIHSATLELYFFQWQDRNPAGRVLTLRRLLANWDERTVTWRTRPTWLAIISATAVVPDKTDQWMDWDVTNDVQDMIDGVVVNNGWALRDEKYWGRYDIPTSCFYTHQNGQFVPVLRIYKSGGDTIYVPDNYSRIQDAIDASGYDDIIIVRPGTYVENIDFRGNPITVKSEYGAESTVLDGNRAGSVVTFQSGENELSVLDGFSIRNGDNAFGCGGGVYCYKSDPLITNNIVAGNKATLGGGLYISACSPVLTNNTIKQNEATSDGGGIYCFDSYPVVTNNIISGNKAASKGGGICCQYYSTLINTNNTICGNVADVEAGGILVDGLITIKNTILWNNYAPKNAQIGHGYAIPTVTYCDVTGGWSGTGNIDDDPLFSNVAKGDLHLTWASPCRDAGHNNAGGALHDFEGDPRITGTVDMGADEFYYHLYSVGDVLPGAPIDINLVGIPGLAALLALGTGIQDPPQSTPHGDLWLTLPLAKSWQLGAVPATGILTHTATIPSGWVSGSQHPFQALVGPWGGGATRLTNLLTLTVE
jgi:parallel beta-helix repeat protein